MNILVVGNGGREHAICWKLAQSSLVDKVIAVPGNGGTAFEEKCVNVDPKKCDYIVENGDHPYVQVAKHENCRMVVIGPEDPLADGLADVFWNAGIPCVGPKSAGAQLEASKDLSKKFMKEYNVDCAASETFVNQEAAVEYVKNTALQLLSRQTVLQQVKVLLLPLQLKKLLLLLMIL